MTYRLQVEELLDGRVVVRLQRSGQSFPEASGDPVPFSSPFDDAKREDIRWYIEDYLTAPYAVYEERGRGSGRSTSSATCPRTADNRSTKGRAII